MFRYFLLYKPYNVLCQFHDQAGRPTLKDLYRFPNDVYPVGRLDMDSEGLLLITNDKFLNHRLLNPSFRHRRVYWVQVEGCVTDEAIHQLSIGVTIAVEGKKHRTLPADVHRLVENPPLPPRIPPVRFRKTIPDSWLSMTLVEGKNRQVRKMTAAVGFPTLRLVRVAIEELTLENMQVGEVKELSKQIVYRKLRIS